MKYSGLDVQQRGQTYTLSRNGNPVAQVYMGNDGNYLLDAKCIEMISEIMARRLGIKKPANKNKKQGR